MIAAIPAVARTILAALFGIAAIAKVRDPQGTRRAANDLGVPQDSVAAVAVALPAVEGALALALLVPVTAAWAAVAALALLEAFTVVVAANNVGGRLSRCACFGTLLPPELESTGASVARNVAMAALAALSLRAAGPPWQGNLGWDISLPAALAIGAVGAWLGGRSRVRELPATPIGWRAPRLPHRNIGRAVSTDHADEARLIVIWSPACTFSRELLPALRTHVTERAPGAPTVVLVSSGRIEDHRDVDLDVPILIDEANRTARALAVTGTPAAVLVGGDGRIASRIALGSPDVLALLDEVTPVTAAPALAMADGAHA